MRLNLLCLIALCLAFNPVKLAADSAPIHSTNPVFERIAICESRNDPHAKNTSSSASGRFQFLWSTWIRYGSELWGDSFFGKNIFDYKDNTELAWYVFTRYGTKDWNASKSCWQIDP